VQCLCNGRAVRLYPWLNISRLSHRSTAAAACGGFAAERPAGRRHRSIAAGAGAQQQRRRSRALSSKCGQCHVDSRVDEAEHRLVKTRIAQSLYCPTVLHFYAFVIYCKLSVNCDVCFPIAVAFVLVFSLFCVAFCEQRNKRLCMCVDRTCKPAHDTARCTSVTL